MAEDQLFYFQPLAKWAGNNITHFYSYVIPSYQTRYNGSCYLPGTVAVCFSHGGKASGALVPPPLR